MSDEIRDLFQGALREEGYGFEAAVAFKLRQLSENAVSRWRVVTGEFPVSARAYSTRIDILLATDGYDELAVCECKRANPAINRWCFARLPHVGGVTRHDYEIHVDSIRRWPGDRPVVKRIVRGHMPAFAHVGLPIRSGQRGDARGESREAIEDALTQVARGTNGLIQFLHGHDNLLPQERDVPLYQIIFTTATLWLSAANLNLTDLATGDVDLKQGAFEQVDSLMYQYPQSPTLRSDVPVSSTATTLLGARDDLYYRSVFIVSAGGIEDFIGTLR